MIFELLFCEPPIKQTIRYQENIKTEPLVPILTSGPTTSIPSLVFMARHVSVQLIPLIECLFALGPITNKFAFIKMTVHVFPQRIFPSGDKLTPWPLTLMFDTSVHAFYVNV